MPKVKGHKGLAKRVKVTGTGKVKHQPSGRSHLNSGFTGDQKRKKGNPMTLHKSVAKKLETSLHTHLKGRS